MYAIAYLPNALEDYEQTIVWYSKHSISATENFIAEVRKKIEAIKINPAQFKNKYKNYYETSLEKFPFDIVYIIEQERVVIVSIYHHKRNPKRKYRARRE